MRTGTAAEGKLGAAVWLQLVPDSRHHPGIHRPLYPLLNLTAQRFHFLCRVAYYNKAPFAGIQPLAIAAFTDRHRRLSSVALVDTAHALPLLFQRAAARQ